MPLVPFLRGAHCPVGGRRCTSGPADVSNPSDASCPWEQSARDYNGALTHRASLGPRRKNLLVIRFGYARTLIGESACARNLQQPTDPPAMFWCFPIALTATAVAGTLRLSTNMDGQPNLS